mmetsp:Transcript_54385/g.140501  ORF Transcript_54385/g.140501 Transcript_54385/m.140501 type:complete len:237 (+) Transcript_54385:1202-1912(+)
MRTPGQMNCPPVYSQSAAPGPRSRRFASASTTPPTCVKSAHGLGGKSYADVEIIGSTCWNSVSLRRACSASTSAWTSISGRGRSPGKLTPSARRVVGGASSPAACALLPERRCSSTSTYVSPTASMQRAWKPGHSTGMVMSSSCDLMHSPKLRGSVVHSSELCFSSDVKGVASEESGTPRASRTTFFLVPVDVLPPEASAKCVSEALRRFSDVGRLLGASGAVRRELPENHMVPAT